MNEDENLREALRQAHADDRPPPFRGLEALRGGRRRRFARFTLALVSGAVAAALLWGVHESSVRKPAPPLQQPGAWQAPLDFLLRTPGSELLSEVPRFGGEEISR